MAEDTVHGDRFILIQSGVVAFLILLPLSMKTDMSAFRYISLASIGALVYVGVLLLVELPKYFNWYWDDAEGKIAPVWFDMNLFTGANMNFFAF